MRDKGSTKEAAAKPGRRRGLQQRFLKRLGHLALWAGLAIQLEAASVPAARSYQPPVAARGLLLDAAVVSNAIIAVGEHGTILRSIDSGRTWEKVATPALSTLTCIVFADARNGWASGHDGVVLHTKDAGENWTVQYEAESKDVVLLDLATLDPKRLFAVGAFGLFWSSVDGGRTWTPRELLEEDLHLNRITVGDNNALYIACERGALLRLNDLGRGVTLLPSPYEGSFNGILPLGKGTLLAYGLRGHIFRSVDEGATWNLVPLPEPTLLSTAIRLRSGTVVVAGQARAFWISVDNGVTFSRWPTALTTAVAELLEMPDGAVLAIGEAGATRLDAPPAPPVTAGMYPKNAPGAAP
jgi:photosystem II stability/assembly factor-like uncharacterized protein